jgi:hypothetical protein
MQITREHLEEQLAGLKHQAQQASVTLQNAIGAIAVIEHLLKMEAEPDAAPMPQPDGGDK